MTLFASALSAQTRPYDKVTDRNLWLLGTNYAGLREDTSASISYAELYGGAEAGGYRRSYEASSLWHAGAEARTIKHLERFSMIGGFSFDQNTGQDMCGSMFIHPGYYPVDALEFTPGQKTLQTYAFDGGVSIDLTESLRAGAGMDFESANYSKRKDLRHTNYRLDMTVTPGLTWTAPDRDLTVGANYIFRKNSESCVPEQIGTGESTYYAFLDKGLMYGKYEAWSGSGVHLHESGVQGLPLKEIYHGFGLQTYSNDNFYCDMEVLFGNGTAGEKQTVWYRFPTTETNVHIGEIIDKGDRKFYFREFYHYVYQTNNETVLDRVTVNGVTTTQEYGSNLILDRNIHEVRVELEFVKPEFEYLAALSASTTDTKSSQMYPFVTESTLNVLSYSFAPTWHRGAFDFGLTADISIGFLKESDRSVSDDSGVLTRPYRLQEYYDLWAAYETSPRVGAAPFVRLNLKDGLYLQADAVFRKGFSGIIPGSRYGGSICFGWSF